MNTSKIFFASFFFVLLILPSFAYSVEGDEYSINITIHTVNGEISDQVVTKLGGEVLTIVVKPKANFIGIIEVDGVIVAQGQEGKVTRYRFNVSGNHTISINYSTENSDPTLPIFTLTGNVIVLEKRVI